MSGHVLIIDDEPGVRESLRVVLEYEGYRVTEATSGRDGLDQARSGRPDLIFLDIKMPHMDGLEVLRRLRESSAAPPVIMISGHGTITTAVEATKLGAYDFIEKPLGSEKVILTAQNALRRSYLEKEVAELSGKAGEIIGESPAMQAVRQAIRKAAPTNATVLITGESGTGKELVAQAIHRASQRADKELVRVNCAAIPEELIESELFGHEKGSFTGATGKQKGKFVQADGGTIFLDEIGDMSLKTQSKVLRALQDGEVEPVGAGRSTHVDVRAIAATNKDLAAEIAAGRFREDLYFRLAVIPIHLPPVRERHGDIPLLVSSFIQRWAEESGRRAAALDPGAIPVLEAHPWHGNVRELRNTIERLLIMVEGERLGAGEVQAVLAAAAGVPGAPPVTPATVMSDTIPEAPTLKEFRDAAERTYLVKKLREHDWNVAATARAIGTPRSNLYKKLEAHDIRRETDGRA